MRAKNTIINIFACILNIDQNDWIELMRLYSYIVYDNLANFNSVQNQVYKWIKMKALKLWVQIDERSIRERNFKEALK